MRFLPKFSTTRLRHLALEIVVAWCLAFIAWLYLQTRARQTLDHISIPITVQLASGQRDAYALEMPGVPKATLSFSGPSSRMRDLRRKLSDGQIQVTVLYSIPTDKLKEITYTDVARLSGAQIDVPPGIRIEWNDRNLTIPLTLHQLGERTLPVRLESTGDVRVSQIKIEPPTVVVRGPKAILDRAQGISTLPYEFRAPADENPAASQAKDTVGLLSELDGRLVQVTPNHVQFKCKVQPRKQVYELTNLPIRFAIPDQFPWHARFEANGGKISLRVIGPAGEEAPTARAYVDLAQEAFGRGRNVGPVRIELPKDFELVERRSPTVAFYLDDRDIVEHNAARPGPGFEIRPVANPKKGE